jgi:pimeloyl-ACP methyl ester carboxylesterase
MLLQGIALTQEVLSLEEGRLDFHYTSAGAGQPVLVLIHSLSANARVFDGLLQHGLAQDFRILLPDLRGRGRSRYRGADYSLERQALDLLHLMDAEGLDRIVLGGHSFGGLFSMYFAAKFPERVSHLLLLDAAVHLHPLTPLLILPSLQRLLHPYPNWEIYLQIAKHAPFYDFWEDAMLGFHQEDVDVMPNGIVMPRVKPWVIACLEAAIMMQPWRQLAGRIDAPTLLLRARDPYVGGQCLLPRESAEQTVGMMRRASLTEVPGNHQTMLYGSGASEITASIRDFLRSAGNDPRP